MSWRRAKSKIPALKTSSQQADVWVTPTDVLHEADQGAMGLFPDERRGLKDRGL